MAKTRTSNNQFSIWLVS